MMFSIIVPVYNAGKYLRRCVDSVLEQDFQDFELILVDDGSFDDSPAICDEYAEKDERVVVIRKNNGGATSARREGLSIARGEYVLFVDGDDFIKKELLSKMRDILSSRAYDVICFGYSTFPIKTRKTDVKHYAEGEYDKRRIEEDVYPTLVTGEDGVRFPPSLWGKVFKRELVAPIQSSLPDDIVIGEDSCVVYPAVYLAETIYITHDELYCYRVEKGSLTRSEKCFSWDEPLKRAEFYFKYLPKDAFEDQVARITAHSIFNVAISILKTKKYVAARAEINEMLSDERIGTAVKSAVFRNDLKEILALRCLKKRRVFLMKIISRIAI